MLIQYSPSTFFGPRIIMKYGTVVLLDEYKYVDGAE